MELKLKIILSLLFVCITKCENQEDKVPETTLENEVDSTADTVVDSEGIESIDNPSFVYVQPETWTGEIEVSTINPILENHWLSQIPNLNMQGWDLPTPHRPSATTESIEKVTKWEPSRLLANNLTTQDLQNYASDEIQLRFNHDHQITTPTEIAWKPDGHVSSVKYQTDNEEWSPNTQIEETRTPEIHTRLENWTPIHSTSSVKYDEFTDNGLGWTTENSNSESTLKTSTWSNDENEENTSIYNEGGTSSTTKDSTWSTEENSSINMEETQEPNETNNKRPWVNDKNPELNWNTNVQSVRTPQPSVNQWEKKKKLIPVTYTTRIIHAIPVTSQDHYRSIPNPAYYRNINRYHHKMRPVIPYKASTYQPVHNMIAPYTQKPKMTMAPVSSYIDNYNKNTAENQYQQSTQHPYNFEQPDSHIAVSKYQDPNYIPPFKASTFFKNVEDFVNRFNTPTYAPKKNNNIHSTKHPHVQHEALPIPAALHQIAAQQSTPPSKSHQYQRRPIGNGGRNRQRGGVKEQKEIRKGNSVKGYYTLREIDGSKRVVYYTSNQKDGFKVFVEHKRPHKNLIELIGVDSVVLRSTTVEPPLVNTRSQYGTTTDRHVDEEND